MKFAIKNHYIHLIHVNKTFWLPKKLLTDRCVQYISTLFEDFCCENVLQHIKTTPYNPRANSFVERINQSISCLLRTENGSELKELPDKIKTKPNYSKNGVMKISLFEKRFLFIPFDMFRKDITRDLEQK